MIIQIQIPDNAIKDVEEYCRDILHANFRDRIQREVDTFVNNALEQMEQRRKIRVGLDNLVKAFREAIEGESCQP